MYIKGIPRFCRIPVSVLKSISYWNVDQQLLQRQPIRSINDGGYQRIHNLNNAFIWTFD